METHWPKFYYNAWSLNEMRAEGPVYKRGPLRVAFEDGRSMEYGELELPKNWELN